MMNFAKGVHMFKKTVGLALVVVLCANSLRAADSNSPRPGKFVIKPLTGIGTLKFGAKQGDVIKVLGEPQKKSDLLYEYTNAGLVIGFGSAGKLASIVCGDAIARDSPLIRKCRCATDANITMGSTAEQILKAYGPPSQEHIEKGIQYLKYGDLGAVFGLRDDRVVHMVFIFKKFPKPGK
jgi:hypothetical protein